MSKFKVGDWVEHKTVKCSVEQVLRTHMEKRTTIGGKPYNVQMLLFVKDEDGGEVWYDAESYNLATNLDMLRTLSVEKMSKFMYQVYLGCDPCRMTEKIYREWLNSPITERWWE